VDIAQLPDAAPLAIWRLDWALSSVRCNIRSQDLAAHEVAMVKAGKRQQGFVGVEKTLSEVSQVCNTSSPQPDQDYAQRDCRQRDHSNDATK
jgi:hypothetical protein